MTDIFSKDKRSRVMASVSGKETKPELTVRKLLFNRGFRYRKNVKSLPAKPDIVLPKYKTVILVHGCFWHQHENCSKAKRPTSRVEFWNEKLDETIKRDKKNIGLLKDLGWKVIIVWECELRDMEMLSNRLLPTLDPKYK